MLELKKAEWFETLGEFDSEIIMETIADVKKTTDEYPVLQKFYAIATGKAKQRKARREMEERERQTASGKILEHNNPDAAERAREQIRRVCGLRSAIGSGQDNIGTDENHSIH